ncbi:MAG: S1 RNA-binding domain-containing protein, partial [Chloroflexota bacterium]|nr:S1 RNA-binding domain-containing protein [Chloroflexota bacterium]
MTADLNLGKDREGKRVQSQDHQENQIDAPLAPNEVWWAAVLADGPLVEDVIDPIESPGVDDSDFIDHKPSQKPLSVNWEKIERIFNNDEIVTLSVIGHNRGGILVQGEDIHGFVPVSHLVDLPADISGDEREDYLSSYMDREIDLKVIECEPEKDRAVFSERAALAKEGQRKHLLNSLVEGDVVSGVVTNVTSFGAFVDLGGLEGLIHISELSWGRVKHPSEILNVDDKIETTVLQVSEDEGRIALSLKRLEKNPWEVLDAVLSLDDVIEARISSIVRYGAFAEIECGIEGLIHISSINIPEDCKHIDDFLCEGQRVLVRVL